MISREEREELERGSSVLVTGAQKVAALYLLSSRLLFLRGQLTKIRFIKFRYGEEVAVLNSFQTVTGWRSPHGR